MLELNSDFRKDVIFLCIGTDRATGDSLGPLVGTRLKSFQNSAHVFGTLENPVHATNISNVLDNLENSFNKRLIIAVDASLGQSNRIGYINVRKGSLKPGTALKKSLPEVGDCNITAVVNVGGLLDHLVLQNTRLHIVYKMSDLIARSLFLANLRFESSKKDYFNCSQAAKSTGF